MLDHNGANKGYFTVNDLAFHLMILPNTDWNGDKTNKLIDQLLQEGKLEQIEPGKKFKPTEKT